MTASEETARKLMMNANDELSHTQMVSNVFQAAVESSNRTPYEREESKNGDDFAQQWIRN